jgi:3-oxoadipate enol-lactonase
VPFVELDDAKLHYAEAGDGPAVVLVHGLACGWRSWRSQMRALAPRYRVVAYDQRGHGLSSAPEDPAAYSEDILAEDLAGLIRGLGLAPVAAVGLSMGGGVALNLVERHPELVAALVLAATGSGSDDLDTGREIAQPWAGAARLGGTDAFARRMLASPLLKMYLRDGGERAHRHMRLLIERHPAQGLANIADGVLARRRTTYARRPGLGRIRVPTLVICGSRDGGCRKPSAFLADAIPNAEMVWLHDVGHMSCLEAPRRFNAALLAFLDRTIGNSNRPERNGRPVATSGMSRSKLLPQEGGTHAA